MKKNEQSYDLEVVYDEKINPLMAQIIAICKEHNMPMLAAFQYAVKDAGTEDAEFLFCTTTLFQADERPIAKELRIANHTVRNGAPGSFGAFTITTSQESK